MQPKPGKHSHNTQYIHIKNNTHSYMGSSVIRKVVQKDGVHFTHPI